MKDIAIYYNKGRAYITVFAFTSQAFEAVVTAIKTSKLKVKGPPKEGRKPGSYKFAVYCSREKFNDALGEFNVHMEPRED